MDRYFIPNVAGIGDWIMRSAIVRDILIAHPDIEMYSSNKAIQWRNKDVIRCKKRKAINKFGAKRIAMRYYPGVKRTKREDGYKTYYELMRGFTEGQIGRPIPETVPHATLSLFDEEKEKASHLPDKYCVLLAQSKTQFKTWGQENFQKCIDALRGDVQFVSIGAMDTEQSTLDGVVDLRGKTTLSEAISIVHHSKCLLSSVGLGSHLGACVPTVDGDYSRKFVTIFGGKEHPDRLPYENMIGFHSVGKLDCCAKTDCYRRKQFGCYRKNQGLVKDCFKMINPEEVALSVSEIYNEQD